MKLYGDFTTQEEIDREYDIESALDMPPYIKWLIESSAQTRDDLDCRLEQQSPLFHIPKHGYRPPLLNTLGGDESAEFHHQSAAFADGWRASGAEAWTFDQPCKDHISAIAGFEDSDSSLCRAVIDFIGSSQ